MVGFLNVVRFNATSSGTGDFVVASATTGYQTPAGAGAVNGTVYSYRAESADLSQWEIGSGVYTTGSTTLARTTIVASSTGSKVNFSAAPTVAVTALAGDLVTINGQTGAITSSHGITNVANDLRVDLSWFPGYISGLTLSNNASDATNDIDVAAGSANDSTDTDRLVLSSTLTKRADAAWAAGSGNGGRFHATLINGTLHYYIIKNPSTGVVDAGCSDDANDPTSGSNYPSGFTLFRRIGSVPRESGAIIGFKQDGDVFQRSIPATNSAVNPGTSAVLFAAAVPVGIRVSILLDVGLAISATGVADYALLVTDPSIADTTPTTDICDLILTTTGTAVFRSACPVVSMTNTSAQIRYRLSTSVADLVLKLTTRAWSDRRGQR